MVEEEKGGEGKGEFRGREERGRGGSRVGPKLKLAPRTIFLALALVVVKTMRLGSTHSSYIIALAKATMLQLA